MKKHCYEHMVVDYYVARVRKLHEERRERIAAIRTQADALDYQRQMRKAVTKAFSPRPPRTPLNARITGIVEATRYRTEKVVFESRPGFLVTANLYVPKGIDEPRPGVIGTCGHANEGRFHDLYQAFAQRLAENAFVTLIFDPISQGERDQYSRLPGRKGIQSCCYDHNMQGKQLELVGDYFGMWRAWDGMRALDYLLSRPEVDPKRVGVTGNSGGGTMTSWLWAAESRFTMAAPSCFITTFLCNLENELPADVEQYPPGVLGAGLEMVDLLIAAAPKPILLLGQKYDYFDRRGLQWTYGELRRFYRLLGAPAGNAQLFIGPRPHGYYVENQEAMVGFFAQQAGLGKAKRVKQPVARSIEELRATPEADVVKAGSRPSYELTAEEADRLAAARKKPTRSELQAALRRILALPARKAVPHYRFLRPQSVGELPVARYAVETEPGIVAILKRIMPDPAQQAILEVEQDVAVYVPHVASETELEEEPLAKELAKSPPLYLIDPRGMGESMPEAPESFFASYGMDYMLHGHGILFGESYLGRRVHDVLATLDLLTGQGARKVRLYGRGQGAVIALFAALLHRKVAEVTLRNAPLSYAEWAHSILVQWPVANVPKGVLKHFDLPDCVRALGRRVKLIEPWNPDMKPYGKKELAAAMKKAGLPMAVLGK
jgi:cephalosporin-C deacetylase-like acetyl esterase